MPILFPNPPKNIFKFIGVYSAYAWFELAQVIKVFSQPTKGAEKQIFPWGQ